MLNLSYYIAGIITILPFFGWVLFVKFFKNWILIVCIFIQVILSVWYFNFMYINSQPDQNLQNNISTSQQKVKIDNCTKLQSQINKKLDPILNKNYTNPLLLFTFKIQKNSTINCDFEKKPAVPTSYTKIDMFSSDIFVVQKLALIARNTDGKIVLFIQDQTIPVIANDSFDFSTFDKNVTVLVSQIRFETDSNYEYLTFDNPNADVLWGKDKPAFGYNFPQLGISKYTRAKNTLAFECNVK